MRCLLFFLRNKKPANYCQAGFTLLELLIVISLLGLIAGMAMLSLNDVSDQSRADATQFEMAEIRKALLQFRRDSGSRDFPGQGVYDCSSLIPTAQLNDPAGSDTWPNGAPSADTDQADWVAWCQHPANFWMLFINPRDDLTTPAVIEGGWDADTKRGWNGPYIQRKSGYLDIDADYNTDGTLAAESSTLIFNVWGAASAYLSKPLTNGDLAWRTTIASDNYSNYGTPYLLFDLDLKEQARIVSMASDNLYDEADDPDCEQILDSEENPFDNILCLLQ